ncbi:MAG TPA: hypothetical protein VGM90_39750 [Kofleriaceae bacterium]|jgi:hypothetical protein
MKRLVAVALIVVAASACKSGGVGGNGTTHGPITRQYDPQTYQQTSHGDLDRAIGQR